MPLSFMHTAKYSVMKLIKYFSIVLLIPMLFVLGCSNNDDEPDIDGMDPTDPVEEIALQQRLQNIVDSKIGIDQDKLVGVSVSIRLNGEERWVVTGGVSETDVPVNPNMKFGVGSVTKTVIAATILKLEEEGLLSTEETIGDHLSLNTPKVDESITIFQLLSHFTGLGGYFGAPLWERVEGDLDTAVPPLDIVDYIKDPINQPGIAHEYSNSNYLILSLIIESVTQQTVGEAMRERLWSPLQLNNIYFGANETITEPIASAWRDSNGDGVLQNISGEYRAAYHSVFYGAAGIFATASDLSHWAYDLVEGEALSAASRDKMLTRYAEIPDPTFTGYGLGMRRNVYAGKVMWGHTGGVRGYGAHVFHDPTNGVSIAVVNNQSRSANGPLLRHELINELLEEVYGEL